VVGARQHPSRISDSSLSTQSLNDRPPHPCRGCGGRYRLLTSLTTLYRTTDDIYIPSPYSEWAISVTGPRGAEAALSRAGFTAEPIQQGRRAGKPAGAGGCSCHAVPGRWRTEESPDQARTKGITVNRALPALALLLASYTFRTPPAHGPAGSGPSSQVETEIINLEYEMMQASKSGDRQTLERIIGEDFLLTTGISSDHTLDKRRFIDGAPNLAQVESFRFHDFTIRLFGRTAILICRLDWKSRWAGLEWESEFVLTDVWYRSDRSWQIVSRHSSYAATDG
jgi:uncharacterized protein DUF4440